MKDPRLYRRAIGGAAVALAAFALASCSSGTASPTTTTQSAKGSPLNLAEFSDNPTSETADGDSAMGVQIGVKYINSHGGVQGHRLNVTYCADNHDPSQATTCADNAVANPATVASINQYASQGAVLDPILQKAGVAAIGLNAFGGADFTSPISFPTNSGAFVGLGGVAAITDQLHGTKISLVYPDDSAGATLAPTVSSVVLKPRKLTLMNSVPVPVNATDLSSYVSKAIAGSPDGIVVFLSADLANNFVTTARQLGSTAPVLLPGTDETAARVKQQLGTQTQDLYFFNYYHSAGPSYNKLVAQMKATGYPVSGIDDNVISGWLSVQIFNQIASKLPTITRSTVLAAASNLSSVNTGGLTPPLSFATPGTALGGNAPRMFNVTSTLYKFVNGKISPYKGSPFVNPFTPPASTATATTAG